MSNRLKLLHQRIISKGILPENISYIVIYFENKEQFDSTSLGQGYDISWQGEDTPHIMLYTISNDMYNWETKILDSGLSCFDVVQFEEDYDNDILYRPCGRHDYFYEAFDSLDRMFYAYNVLEKKSCFLSIFNVAFDVDYLIENFEDLLLSDLVSQFVSGVGYRIAEVRYRSAASYFGDLIEKQVQEYVPNYTSNVHIINNGYYFVNEIIYAISNFKSKNFLDLLRVAIVDNDFAITPDVLYTLNKVDKESLIEGFNILFSRDTSEYSIYHEFNPNLQVATHFVVDTASLFLARELYGYININFVSGLMNLISINGFLTGLGHTIDNENLSAELNWTEIFDHSYTLQPLYCNVEVFNKLSPYIRYSWLVYLLRNGLIKQSSIKNIDNVEIELTTNRDGILMRYKEGVSDEHS